jgi:RND family efflux transporter MFP subunit
MAEPQHEDYSPAQRRRLKQRLRVVLWVLLILAIVIAIWGIASRLIDRSHLRKRTVEDSRLAVVTVTPQLSGAGDELVLPGVVQAYIEASIYARTSGYLKNWYTDIGTRVRKGQLLAEIDTPEVDRQLSQARADLNTALANLALSQTTNKRWQALLATQSVSQQDADEKAGDEAAKEAMAESARQNVARLNDLESFKRLQAPFDGVVTARNTDIGALINAGESTGTQLFRVAETDRLRVYAQVPETYAGATTTGLEAELHFAEHPGKIYRAETIRTSNALDPTARTLQVELQLDNQDGELFPGAYTEVHFKLPASTQTLRLPANTVLFRAAGMQVATVGDDGKVKLKNIAQGRDFGKTVEVLDGVQQNDVVIVNPPDSLADGVPVRIAPPPSQQTQSTGEPGSHQQPSQQRNQQQGGTQSSGGGQNSSGSQHANPIDEPEPGTQAPGGQQPQRSGGENPS